MARVKGTAVQSLLRYVRERFGDEALDAILASPAFLRFMQEAPEFCERIYAWMHRTLELAGARSLESAHSLCVHRGDAVCRFEGSGP